MITIPAIGLEKEMGSSQEEILMANPFPDSTKPELDLEESVRELEGLHKNFSDDDESDSEYVADASKTESKSFYLDESNKDISDDDLIFDKHANRTVHEDYDNF